MSIDGTAVQEVADLANRAYESEALEIGQVYAFNLGDRVETIDLTGDKYRDQPRRKKGTTVVRDVASFLAFYDKHGDGASEVYADRDQLRVTAILDADDADQARWGGHRLVLQLTHTDAFKAWAGISGKLLPQVQFAEFVEEHRPDILTPDAATVLEMAQTFQATSTVSFRSGTILKSGQRQLSYVEQGDATAGPTGNITIPDSIDLGVEVFEGAGMADTIHARFRYRIESGHLKLAVILDQLTDVVRGAFEGYVTAVADGLAKLDDHPNQMPILRGTPVPPTA